ncbi:MAG: JAB domain-containing protein, partial [Dictyoglomaceae bacterium]|nr:JAB domain-containing protein [Dictyoglomaceae bacterium]
IFTKRIIEAGKIIGLEVLDHLIIGNNRFLSLKEKNYI